MLFGRHVTVALGVVIVGCEGVEAANRFEKAGQIGWGSLCHDIDIDRQPSCRGDPQEEAGTTLELKGEPTFCEMPQKLEGDDGFIHVGWDYYLYVGVAQGCPEARRLAAERGLFVEPCVSPYHPESEQDDRSAAGP